VSRILYYILVVPLSKLPIRFIYGYFYVFYILIYYIIPYRKKVVKRNLTQSFPNLNHKEINKLKKRFYKEFCYMFAESVKNLSISEKNLKKIITVKNPELIDDLHKKGKSIILMSSHYNNWEYLITAQNIIFPHQAIGIGMPLSNQFWDKKINARRERFGMVVVNNGNYKEKLEEFKDIPTATLVLGDQSPGKIENVFWTDFLNQKTAFFFGGEYLANLYNMPVVSIIMHKISRGKYELELQLISENPKNEAYGFITQSYINQLEKTIKKQPENWLWTHKRWKISPPENLTELKEKHQKRFEDKFRA